MEDIQGYAQYIYNTLGAGLSERVYHNAMEVILRKNNIQYETERIVPINFEGHVIGHTRADLIVDGTIVLELKAVKTVTKSMESQTQNYLRQTGIPRALIINFPQPQGAVCEFLLVEGGK
jgi:GxxExxY protein